MIRLDAFVDELDGVPDESRFDDELKALLAKLNDLDRRFSEVEREIYEHHKLEKSLKVMCSWWIILIGNFFFGILGNIFLFIDWRKFYTVVLTCNSLWTKIFVQENMHTVAWKYLLSLRHFSTIEEFMRLVLFLMRMVPVLNAWRSRNPASVEKKKSCVRIFESQYV